MGRPQFRGVEEAGPEGGGRPGREGHEDRYNKPGKAKAPVEEIRTLALSHGQSPEELGRLAETYGADTADVQTALVVAREYGVKVGQVLALAKRFDMAPGLVKEAMELAQQTKAKPETVLREVRKLEDERKGLGYRDIEEAFGDVHEIFGLLGDIQGEFGFTDQALAETVVPGLRDVHIQLQHVHALGGIVERLVEVIPAQGDLTKEMRQTLFGEGLSALARGIHPADTIPLNSQSVMAALEGVREGNEEEMAGKAGGPARTVKQLKNQLASAMQKARVEQPEEEAGAEEAGGTSRIRYIDKLTGRLESLTSRIETAQKEHTETVKILKQAVSDRTTAEGILKNRQKWMSRLAKLQTVLDNAVSAGKEHRTRWANEIINQIVAKLGQLELGLTIAGDTNLAAKAAVDRAMTSFVFFDASAKREETALSAIELRLRQYKRLQRGLQARLDVAMLISKTKPSKTKRSGMEVSFLAEVDAIAAKYGFERDPEKGVFSGWLKRGDIKLSSRKGDLDSIEGSPEGVGGLDDTADLTENPSKGEKSGQGHKRTKNGFIPGANLLDLFAAATITSGLSLARLGIRALFAGAALVLSPIFLTTLGVASIVTPFIGPKVFEYVSQVARQETPSSLKHAS